MAKQAKFKMWCVYGIGGYPIYYTLRELKEDAIEAYTKGDKKGWVANLKSGFSIRRVYVKMKDIHG